ncbi:MAG TPA: SAM-dependent methyltransferase, partial [Streptosporangiaceae bacterium]
EAGIRQFLDNGTGMASRPSTTPTRSRSGSPRPAGYVDHDPIVLAHARSLLSSTPDGACAYLKGDLREPEAILSAAAGTLDFSQPVAVMLIAVMHFTGDDAQARSILDRLTGAWGPGSFLALSHAAAASGMFVTACMSSGTPAATQAPSSVPASPTGSVGAAAAPRL